MQFVEFGGGDDDNESELRLPDPKANKKAGQSLESLLTNKNKRIVEELTRMRVRFSLSFRLPIDATSTDSRADLSSPLLSRLAQVTNEDLALLSTSLEESLASTQAELAKQKNLNEKLENDLVSVNKHHHGEAGPSSVPERAVGPLGGTGGLSGLDFGGKGGAVRPLSSFSRRVLFVVRATN